MTKVVSINAEQTKSMQDVAFNVDVAPVQAVLDRVKYGRLQLSWDGNVLRVRVPTRDGDPPLDASVIANLNSKFAAAESELASETKRAADKHKQQLLFLSQQTGLPLA
jgi:hypothetical protein